MNNNVKRARDWREVSRQFYELTGSQLLRYKNSGKTTDAKAHYGGATNGLRTAKNQRALQWAKMWQQSGLDGIPSARPFLTD